MTRLGFLNDLGRYKCSPNIWQLLGAILTNVTSLNTKVLDKSATFHAPNNAVNLCISFCVGRVAGSYKFFQARISIVVNEYKD